MVDEALGQTGRQTDLTLGDRDEIVAQSMEPEFCFGGFANGSVNVVDVLEMAGFGIVVGKHPVRFIALLSPPEHSGNLSGDGKLQGFSGFGLFDC